MPFRFLFVFVSAAVLTFAQGEAAAPQGPAAKLSLPPTTSAPAPAPATQTAAQNGVPAATPAKPAAVSPSETTPSQTSPSSSTKAKTEKNTSTGHKPYVFGALDVVRIIIYNQPTMSGAFPISSDGFISIPVAGDIKAEGLTQAQLRTALTQRLKECCINNPEGEVDVQLGKNNSKRFYVIGGVGRPGEYPLDRDDLTVMEALSNVGGFHDFAKKKKIRIQRVGEPKEHIFNYVDVSHGRHMEEDIVIQNEDRIYVDE